MTDVKHDIDALAGERWFPLETTITEDMSSIWGDWGEGGADKGVPA